MAKVILAMETGTIAGNLHFKEANPNIPSLHNGTIEVVNKPSPFPGGLVGINSFGFGGANVHTILEANPAPHVDSLPREKPELPRLVLMAGRNKDSLAVSYALDVFCPVLVLCRNVSTSSLLFCKRGICACKRSCRKRKFSVVHNLSRGFLPSRFRG